MRGRVMPRYAAILVVGLCLAALAGCARKEPGLPVAEAVSEGERITLLAPAGRLVVGRNHVQIRLERHDSHRPVETAVRLEFVQQNPGSIPTRVPVTLRQTGAGLHSGDAVLDMAGNWWAEATFDGKGGTQTLRLRTPVTE